MPVYAVTYTYDEQTDLRMQTRPAHRAFLTTLYQDGLVLAAGAWSDDAQPGGLLIVRAPDAGTVATTIDADPYWRAGVISHREIRQWNQLLSPWSD